MDLPASQEATYRVHADRGTNGCLQSKSAPPPPLSTPDTRASMLVGGGGQDHEGGHTMSGNLHRAHRWDLGWQDASDVLALGEGVQVKVLRQDAETMQTDLLVKFPPGYVEPEHTHDSTHSIVVLEGLQVAEGEPMRPGDYVYGPAGLPHGPFEYPEGCVVFATFHGRSVRHVYEGSPADGSGLADATRESRG